MENEKGAVPITPELFKGLKRRTYRKQRGYSEVEYASVLERVTETGETLSHVEREFSGVSDGHIAYRLSRLTAERDLPVDVAEDAELGVCVSPNPFKQKPDAETIDAHKEAPMQSLDEEDEDEA